MLSALLKPPTKGGKMTLSEKIEEAWNKYPHIGFLIVDRTTEHIYAFYANGQTVGFPSNCYIINNISTLMDYAVSVEKMESTEHSSPSNNPTNSLSGASQG